MWGDNVPTALGMLDREAVVAGILKAEGAILGLFQETGLQEPRAWYIWRITRATMDTTRSSGSMPRRRQGSRTW